MNIEKQSLWPTCDHIHTNNRNRYTISVQEKILKIKKNSNYIRAKKVERKGSLCDTTVIHRNE